MPDRTGKIVRRRAVVHGIVQGVWFRDSTRRRAQDLGLSGWVRNCPDGSVEAVFEGARDAVEQALSFLRTGPARAHVASVQVFDEPPEGLSGFEVR